MITDKYACSLILKISYFYLYALVYLPAHVHIGDMNVLVHRETRTGHYFLGAGVTVGCESPDVDARNQNCVLWKNSNHI